jgi:orotidine-5'-phosphate decarboxylase
VSQASKHIALALDVASLEEARELADAAGPHVGVLKVGLELFVRFGAAAVEIARGDGREVFLDLKLHDIPETVERAVEGVASLGARYLTVHATGGPEMLRRAVRAAAKAPRPLTVLAVTVLTSLDANDLAATGVGRSAADQVLALARMAWEAGVRGFVTSPAEVAALRAALPEAVLVTPGVRPRGGDAGDQKRTATPGRAIADGASLLVVGRPIRDAENRREAARLIEQEVEAALSTVSAP